MALCTQIVYLVGLYLLYNTDEIGGICEITVMQNKITIINVWILIQVVYSICIEQGASPLYPMHFVPFFEQKISEVSAILTGYSCEYCFFRHGKDY
jgi:hypothetical protein